jgi:PleD family two-component response regulator
MTTNKGFVMTEERIRTEFKKEIFSMVPGQDVHVTGEHRSCPIQTAGGMKAFIHWADQLMYTAKKNGQDRVCSES